MKFDQLRMTRPVSGSTSISSLSAASTGAPPDRIPFGFVAEVTSKGPAQVWPQSVDRWTDMVCAGAVVGVGAMNFLTMIDE